MLLDKADENTLRRAGAKEAFAAVLSQCSYYQWDAESAIHMTDLVAGLVQRADVYRLSCRADEGAVRLLQTNCLGDKMENNSAEPRLSSYLHAKACRAGTPLAGNFELTPRCNFNCKMCYVHLSEAEQKRRGAELSADEWLSIAETARSQGMLFCCLRAGSR